MRTTRQRCVGLLLAVGLAGSLNGCAEKTPEEKAYDACFDAAGESADRINETAAQYGGSGGESAESMARTMCSNEYDAMREAEQP